MNDIARRNRIDLYIPAETAIRNAVLAVEEAGAHPLLTDAVNLLLRAKELVADFVDCAAKEKRRRDTIEYFARMTQTEINRNEADFASFYASMAWHWAQHLAETS